MAEKTQVTTSPIRLRFGTLLILIWWLPVWLLAPYISSLFSSTDDAHLTAVITGVIMVIQTIIGFLGILVAGKEIKPIIKNHPKKQALRLIWHMLIHGKLDTPK